MYQEIIMYNIKWYNIFDFDQDTNSIIETTLSESLEFFPFKGMEVTYIVNNKKIRQKILNVIYDMDNQKFKVFLEKVKMSNYGTRR